MTVQEVKAKLDSFKGVMQELIEINESMLKLGAIAFYPGSPRNDGMPRGTVISNPTAAAAESYSDIWISMRSRREMIARESGDLIKECEGMIFSVNQKYRWVMIGYYINGKSDEKLIEGRHYTREGIRNIRYRCMRNIASMN